jgi:hypothetical protein
MGGGRRDAYLWQQSNHRIISVVNDWIHSTLKKVCLFFLWVFSAID